MSKILALCGSLRAQSLNRRALLTACDLAPPGCEILLWEGVRGLPPFSPDLDQPGLTLPPSVREFHREVDAAHGLLIACPEYAHGMPGAFKNALDWLVGSTRFPGKPVALLNIAPRAHHAQASLREVLVTMSAAIVEDACCAVAFPKDEDPASQATFEERLRAALQVFAAKLRSAD